MQPTFVSESNFTNVMNPVGQAHAANSSEPVLAITLDDCRTITDAPPFQQVHVSVG